MNGNERDTHFAGSAELLWDKIADKIIEVASLDPESIDAQERWKQIRQDVHTLVAQHDFDLACHVLKYVDDDFKWRMGKGYSVAQIVENDIPDLPDQPEKPGETG